MNLLILSLTSSSREYYLDNIPNFRFYEPNNSQQKYNGLQLSPSLNFKKFHLVAAASITSSVSMPILSKIKASSLTNEIFKSLWAFSIALEASATLIELARSVPAVIIEAYRLFTILPISGVDPEVTFLILVKVLTLSPGFILSGEYPQRNLYCISIQSFFQKLVHSPLQYNPDKPYFHK